MKNFFHSSYIFYMMYAIIASLIFWPLRFLVDSSDMLAYIVLAKNYWQYGILSEANSHWSPLISWLLIPFLYFFDNPVIAFHFLQLLIGFICVYAANLWIKFFDLPLSILLLTQILLSFLIAYFGQVWGTPDLLFLAVLLLLQYFFLQQQSFNTSVRLGLLGGLLFLSKSFGLVFFIAALLLMVLVEIYRKPIEISKNTVIKRAVLAFVVFALISGFWIMVLSIKFHQFTYSSATAYNFSIMNPTINPDVYRPLQHPALMGNLIAPLNKHSLFYWTTPYIFQFKNFNPFLSENIPYYLKVVGRNLSSIRSFYFGLDSGTVLISLIVLLLVIIRKRGLNFIYFFKPSTWYSLQFKAIVSLVASSFILLGLYSLILINHRYVWLVDVSIVILFAFLLTQFKALGFKTAAFVLAIIFCVLAISKPIEEIFKCMNSGKIELTYSNELIRNHITGKRIATLEGDSLMDVYTQSALLSFYTDNQYYGLISKANFKSGIQLKEFEIEYLMQFNKNEKYFLSSPELQMWLNFGALKIYKVLR